jgi:ADP-heptose:LPS heptosyltransferase
MRRYLGETLPPTPRIALLTNDALGNYVVATPLVQMVKAAFPGCRLDWFCGRRSAELVEATPGVDEHIAWMDMSPRELAELALGRAYDLVINNEGSAYALSTAALLAGEDTPVVGPCLGPIGRASLPYAEDAVGELADDRNWLSPTLTESHPILDSGYIGEIFCRLAYLQGPVPPPFAPRRIPAEPTADILIACSASLENKLWSLDAWRAAIAALNALGLSVGLLGAKPKAQGQFWLGSDTEAALVAEGLVRDLRGTMTLPEVCGALSQCRACLTLDNGIMHLAAASGCPAVALFRRGFPALWMPPKGRITALEPEEGQEVSEIPAARAVEALQALGF